MDGPRNSYRSFCHQLVDGGLPTYARACCSGFLDDLGFKSSAAASPWRQDVRLEASKEVGLCFVSSALLLAALRVWHPFAI